MCGRYYIEPDEDDLRFRAALDELNRRGLQNGTISVVTPETPYYSPSTT